MLETWASARPSSPACPPPCGFLAAHFPELPRDGWWLLPSALMGTWLGCTHPTSIRAQERATWESKLKHIMTDGKRDYWSKYKGSCIFPSTRPHKLRAGPGWLSTMGSPGRISGPTPDLLPRHLHVHKTPCDFLCTLSQRFMAPVMASKCGRLSACFKKPPRDGGSARSGPTGPSACLLALPDDQNHLGLVVKSRSTRVPSSMIWDSPQEGFGNMYVSHTLQLTLLIHKLGKPFINDPRT